MKLTEICPMTNEAFQVYWEASNLYFKDSSPEKVAQVIQLVDSFLDKYDSILKWSVSDEQKEGLVTSVLKLKEMAGDDKLAPLHYAMMDDYFETITAMQQSEIKHTFIERQERIHQRYAFHANIDPIGLQVYESSAKADVFYATPLSLMKMTLDAYLSRLAYMLNVSDFIPTIIRYRVIRSVNEGKTQYRLITFFETGGEWKDTYEEIAVYISQTHYEAVRVIENIVPEETGLISPFPNNQFDTRKDDHIEMLESLIEQFEVDDE